VREPLRTSFLSLCPNFLCPIPFPSVLGYFSLPPHTPLFVAFQRSRNPFPSIFSLLFSFSLEPPQAPWATTGHVRVSLLQPQILVLFPIIFGFFRFHKTLLRVCLKVGLVSLNPILPSLFVSLFFLFFSIPQLLAPSCFPLNLSSLNLWIILSFNAFQRLHNPSSPPMIRLPPPDAI